MHSYAISWMHILPIAAVLSTMGNGMLQRWGVDGTIVATMTAAQRAKLFAVKPGLHPGANRLSVLESTVQQSGVFTLYPFWEDGKCHFCFFNRQNITYQFVGMFTVGSTFIFWRWNFHVDVLRGWSHWFQHWDRPQVGEGCHHPRPPGRDSAAPRRELMIQRRIWKVKG